MPRAAPKAAQASSAATRRLPRSLVAFQRRVLVDPGAAVIAIDADRREIDDDRESSPARARRRVAAASGRRPRPARPRRGADPPPPARRASAGRARPRRARARSRPSPSAAPPSPACAPCRRSRRTARHGAGSTSRPNSRCRSRRVFMRRAPIRRGHPRPPLATDRFLQGRRAGEIQPRQRPDRRAPHHRSGSSRCGRTASTSPALPAASSPVALPAAISTLRMKRFRPVRLIGEPGELGTEGRVVEREQIDERRRLQIRARPQLRLPRLMRELVPGADRQAIVAAVDSVAHQRPQPPVDRAFVLDGEVGDAPPAIQQMRRREGVGRADVEAAPA